MSFPCPDRGGFYVAAVLLLAVACEGRVLRVCADPDNLPFSNRAAEGFENRLADLIARDLDARLEYEWWPEQRGFVRKSLGAGHCDVILGIASTVETVLPTKPYYRSSYVFVSRKDRKLGISSLMDERLAGWRIGMQMAGEDYVPPANVLARRGLGANLVGFRVFAPRTIVDAVGNGDVDVAIMWGPSAGYFAKATAGTFDLQPVAPAEWMGMPFTFDISMGVRREDAALRDELNGVLARECAAIGKLLAVYGVPTVAEAERKCEGSQQPASVSSR